MRCRRLATSLLVVVAASFPFAASAALIEVVSVDRSVTADADHFQGPPNTHSVFSFNPAGLITAQAASVGTGPTDVVTSSSQQSSVIDDDSISVGGGGQAFGNPGSSYGMQSHYDLSFQVTEGSSFTLFSTAIFEFPAATLSITLFDPNGVALVDEDRSGAGTPVVSEVGVVVPGLHRLLIELTRTGSTSEILPGAGYSLNFDLSFTPIPEPSAAALLMLGLVALARRR